MNQPQILEFFFWFFFGFFFFFFWYTAVEVESVIKVSEEMVQQCNVVGQATNLEVCTYNTSVHRCLI